MRKLPTNFNKGQTVLIILLIIAIILTVGLSIISSSISDIKISQETEEASRAFYVAEAALEEAMSLGAGLSNVIEGISYSVEVKEQSGLEYLISSPLESGAPHVIWLVGHNSDGSLNFDSKYTGEINFYWGNKDSSEVPALSVLFLYKKGNKYLVSRYNFDPDGERRSKNHFDSAQTGSYSVAGQDLKYSSSFSIPSDVQPIFLNVFLNYNGTPQYLAIKTSGGNLNLPSQGNCYESEAKVSASGVTRRIEQCKTWENFPEIFLWGVFSGKDLKK